MLILCNRYRFIAFAVAAVVVVIAIAFYRLLWRLHSLYIYIFFLYLLFAFLSPFSCSLSTFPPDKIVKKIKNELDDALVSYSVSLLADSLLSISFVFGCVFFLVFFFGFSFWFRFPVALRCFLL